jgi:hypothetical protein
MKYAAYLQTLLILTTAASTGTAGPVLWVDDLQGEIGKVDVATGKVTLVGNAGAVLTDIAFDSHGNLFGVSFDTFYSVNTNTGLATPIGFLGTGGTNALVFSATGTIYAADFNTENLYTINENTGAATSLGLTGFGSAGDLAFHNGTLYMASTVDTLVQINPTTAAGTEIGPLGVSNVFGLANADNNVLYAVAGTAVYSVNVVTGAATFVLDWAGEGLGVANGEAFIPEAAMVAEPASLTLAGIAFVALAGFLWRCRSRMAKAV